jgi:hypothetical protein
MTDFNSEIISLLMKVMFSERMDEFHNIMNRGNYPIKIVSQTLLYHLPDYEEIADNTTIGYIYDKKFFPSRNDLYKVSTTNSRSINFKDFAEDLWELNRKLTFLCKSGYFDGILTFIMETEDNESELNIDRNWSSDYLINFVIEDSEIFFFKRKDCQGEDIEGCYPDKENFMKKMIPPSDIVSIPGQKWFNKLNNNSKSFVSDGDQLLNIIFKNNHKLRDYSPLLVNFQKALESETSEFYHVHYDKIISNAKIITKAGNDGAFALKKGDEDSKKFIGFCFSLKKYEKGYQPSGSKPIYFLLKYFSLCRGFENIGNFKSILDSTQQNILEKDSAIVDRIFGFGEERNNWIHFKSIESENTFNMYYTDILITLQLLSDIK